MRYYGEDGFDYNLWQQQVKCGFSMATLTDSVDAAVVQYQDVAWLDVFNQLLVVNADALFIAGFLVHAGVQDKLLAGLEGHLVFREACDTKFWPCLLYTSPSPRDA